MRRLDGLEVDNTARGAPLGGKREGRADMSTETSILSRPSKRTCPTAVVSSAATDAVHTDETDESATATESLFSAPDAAVKAEVVISGR